MVTCSLLKAHLFKSPPYENIPVLLFNIYSLMGAVGKKMSLLLVFACCGNLTHTVGFFGRVKRSDQAGLWELRATCQNMSFSLPWGAITSAPILLKSNHHHSPHVTQSLSEGTINALSSISCQSAHWHVLSPSIEFQCTTSWAIYFMLRSTFKPFLLCIVVNVWCLRSASSYHRFHVHPMSCCDMMSIHPPAADTERT